MSAVAVRRKRIPTIRTYAIAAGGTVDVQLERRTIEYAVQVVDATTFAAVAWTLALARDPTARRHFAATDPPLHEENVGARAQPIVLQLGAAVAATAELIVWTC